MRVILASNDRGRESSIRRLLDKNNISIISVNNAAMLMATLGVTRDYHLVIIDLHPQSSRKPDELSGIDTLRKMRADQIDLAVILISADGLHEYEVTHDLRASWVDTRKLHEDFLRRVAEVNPTLSE